MEDTLYALTWQHDKLDAKKRRTFHTQNLINLLNKFETEADETTIELITQLIETLRTINRDDMKRSRDYQNQYKQLTEHIKSTYEWHPEGSTKANYLVYGIVYGIMFGIGAGVINLAIGFTGLPIGLLVGLFIGHVKGSQQEEKLKAEGKLY